MDTDSRAGSLIDCAVDIIATEDRLVTIRRRITDLIGRPLDADQSESDRKAIESFDCQSHRSHCGTVLSFAKDILALLDELEGIQPQKAVEEPRVVVTQH